MSEPPSPLPMKNPPSPRALSRRLLTLSPVLALGILLLLPVGAVGSAAPSAAPASSGSVSWAYAGWSGQTSSGTFSNGNGSFQFNVHTFYAWSVVFTQYNTSATTFFVVGQRNVALVAYTEFCQPACGGSAVDTMNQTSVAYDTDHADANLSTAAVVRMNGTLVPALGIVNDAGSDSANVTQTVSFQGTGPEGGSVSGWSYFSSNSDSNATVAFVPALGLVPLSSVPGDLWSSAANYTESASSSQQIHVCAQFTGGGNPCGSASPTWSVTLAGFVGLQGSDQGTLVLQNGISAQQDDFGLLGAPFGIWDAIFVIPAAGILLPQPGGPTPPPPSTSTGSAGGSTGGSSGSGTSPSPTPVSSPPNGPGAPGSAGAPGTPGVPGRPMLQMNSIDMGTGLPHLGLVAASAGYAPPGPISLPIAVQPPPPNPVPVSTPSAPRTGTTAGSPSAAAVSLASERSVESAATSGGTPGAASVQAQPTSPSEAISLAAEWQALAHLPTTSKGGATSLLESWPVLALVGVVAVGVVLVAMAQRSSRKSRQLPPSSPDYQSFREGGRVAEAKPAGTGERPFSPRQFSRAPVVSPDGGADPMDQLI